MRFSRDLYFDFVRGALFEGALTQSQVDGQNLVLALWENQQTGTPMDDIRWLAYMLATVYWETGQKMWPNIEGGGEDYLQSKDYYPFYGRGFVHLTWEDNYRNASSALGLIDDRDLVEHPEMARDSLIAARILFRGCAEGWFTGAKLGQFFSDDEDNPYDARTIINGHDKAKEIEGFYDEFLEALGSAAIPEQEPQDGEAS